MIFGGGWQTFVTKNESGKREDENLIEVWKRKKEENSDGKTYKVLHNKDDLESWEMTDYALGHYIVMDRFTEFGFSVMGSFIE